MNIKLVIMSSRAMTSTKTAFKTDQIYQILDLTLERKI